MSSELSIILDDASGRFNYSGGQWTLSTLVEWYDSTSYYPATVGSFSLTFEGTSIAFIGNTPPTVSALSQTATVAIDGGPSYNITYGDPNPPSYVQWYQSPTLPDGNHTISVTNLAGTAVDFALISVGSQTPLSGKRIFVDDNNSAIQYTGTWTKKTNRFIAGTLPDGYPAGNSTHVSSTPGDTITFRFSGSSLSVYGIFSWANLGVLSATYTLDGNSLPEVTIPVTTSTYEYVNDYGEASNALLFSDTSIQPGDHTLVINITQCVNQNFMLDYITYLPSFSTLATMPNLTTSVTNVSTSTAHSTNTAPTTSITQPTAPATQNNNGGNRNSTPTGAIVGGVVGGVAIIAILILLLFWLRKRRGKENDSQDKLKPSQTEPLQVVVPQMDQHSALSPVRRQNFAAVDSRTNSTGIVSPFQPSITTHSLGSANDLKRERANIENHHRPRNLPVLPLGTSSGPQSDSDTNSNSARTNLEVRGFVESEPPSYYDTNSPVNVAEGRDFKEHSGLY